MPRKQRFKPSRKPKQDLNANQEGGAQEQARRTGQPQDIDIDSGRSHKEEPAVIEGEQETG